MSIHKWWQHREGEKFWLEVTRRQDIGANLKAPQTNEQGEEFWSYSLVREVRDGDLIYHYDGMLQAVVAYSRASGSAWDDEIIWAARGASARSAEIKPHTRRGWYFGLESFQRLPSPITLETIRERQAAIFSLKESLIRKVGEPLYFPFEMSGKRPLRPMQGYLFKLPRALLELFELEQHLPTVPDDDPNVSSSELGDAYREADEIAAIAARDPFEVDPTLVERGVRGHALTQNSLARYLHSIGVVPRSPRANEPNFDIAWQIDKKCFVAEVKSLTSQNEEKQLRLGLGQVLRYAYQIGGRFDAIPVLVVENEPRDSGWDELCQRLGVLLAWPAVFPDRLLPAIR